MNLIKTTISNALKNIGRNKLVNFLCFGIIAFTLWIFGIFNYITFNLETITNNISKDVIAIFYFHDDVKQEEIDLLIDKLKENLLVKKVEFTSKSQAQLYFSQKFPDLQFILSEYKSSPFPPSIEIEFNQDYNIDTKIISLIEDIERLSIIESKRVDLEWAKNINTLKKVISGVGLFLSLILMFVTSFIIFNVIKISILYRKNEIHVLRLVGATDWYIKFPFIIEGGILGLLGSILAGIFLYIVLKLFPLYASFMIGFFKGIGDFNIIPLGIFIKLILLGTFIGLISSYISAKQFLKN